MREKEEIITKKDYMGMISWARCQCSGTMPLFGSDVATSNPIRLRISHAEVSRMLSNNYYHADAPIIEIDMTPIQWSEFLTSGNTEGTPCTIRTICGERMSKVEPVNLISQFDAELTASAKTVETYADEMINFLKEAIESNKAMGKTKMTELLTLMERYKTRSVESMEFVKGEFEEAMANTVAKAKAEIVAFAERNLSDSTKVSVPALVVEPKRLEE